LAEFVPHYYKDHFQKAKTELKARKTLVRQTELAWWDMLWPRPWQMKPSPKIVSKYFGGLRAFAFDKTGAYVVVVGNAWLIKKNAVLPITPEELYFAILAYLSSTAAFEMLEYLSVQISGGQLDLSGKYIEKLPVPKFSELEPAAIAEMIQMGTVIAKGEMESWGDVDKLILSVLSR